MPVSDYDKANLEELWEDVYDAYEAAETRGDKAAMSQALGLLKDIKQALAGDVFEQYGLLAGRLAKLAAKLNDKSRKKTLPPFWQNTFTHETQFKAVFPDADPGDGGQGVASIGATTKTTAKSGSDGWSEDYQTLWDTMKIRPEWQAQADAMARNIVAHQGRYAQAVAGTPIPWWVAGVVHAMEASLNFTRHLHNGDPLSARTVQVPKGRPAAGFPPFTWVESARDALLYDGLGDVTDWSMPAVLYQWHKFNGIRNEYKRRQMPTPYLWSGSYHYVKGKYVADGKFDPEKVSGQLGAAVILHALVELGAVMIGSKASLLGNAAAAIQDVAALSMDLSSAAFKHVNVELAFPGHLAIGSKGGGVKRLQEWLSLHGAFTSIDGDFGPSTQMALAHFAASHGRTASGVLDDEVWAILTAPLRKAVAPVQPAASLEETVLKVAQQHIAQNPREIGGDNRGPWVRTYMRGSDGSGQLWCAGFVSLIIEQASRDMGDKMPFARQVGVDALVKDAKASGRFVDEGEVMTTLQRQSKLRPGMLYVMRRDPTDWDHVGFVLSAKQNTFDTLEGNTGGLDGKNGDVARQHNRAYASRDFIRLI